MRVRRRRLQATLRKPRYLEGPGVRTPSPQAPPRRRPAASALIADVVSSLIAQGREAASAARSARLEARLTEQQRQTLKLAADLEGRSLSDYVVHAAYQSALISIQNAALVRLSARDTDVLLAALGSPPPPNAALKRAHARHRKLIRRASGD
ncbi:hypothetical protein CAL25_21905 [Bordetella genomosp. 5]|uniref:DUF1778 domain-containing protein n=2 Tax=Bordetella genomosp. 5 TaxID=1395608 RepID=A0A261T8K9_9BORD|nr:hypothetical protein CAL25_21905 [Bordetella genomosp. 5]